MQNGTFFGGAYLVLLFYPTVSGAILGYWPDIKELKNLDGAADWNLADVDSVVLAVTFGEREGAVY